MVTHFPDSFARVVDQNGLTVIKIMDDVEAATVISDVCVAEINILSVLQRHLKVKLNGEIFFFSKKKDLDKLTKRMPSITPSFKHRLSGDDGWYAFREFFKVLFF